MSETALWGVLAEFDGPGQLVRAAEEARKLGYRKVEAYTPYPVEALDEVLNGFDPLPLMVFVGGCCGALTAWTMQYYIAAIDYPLNIGGRPLYSWPAFIVITFELTVLFAAATAFFGTLVLCGFPRPYHPLFSLERFRAASRDSFFLSIEAADLIFNAERATEFLRECESKGVWQIEK